MPWQLAITFAMLAIVATSLIKRSHSQKSNAPPSFPPAISYLLGVAPLGLIAGLMLPHSVSWSGWLIFLLIVIAGFTAIGNWLSFRAIKQLPVMQFQLIARSQVVMIITLGWIFLGEKLSLNQSIGAALLILAAMLAIQAPNKALYFKHRALHVKAVTLSLAGGLAGAIALVSEKASLGHMDIGAYLIFGYTAQALGMLLLATKDMTKSTLKTLTSHEIKWSVFMGISNGIAGVFYVFALVKADNISLIASISSVALPLTVLGAFVILKEKEQQKFVWGALGLSFVGLLVMSMK